MAASRRLLLLVKTISGDKIIPPPAWTYDIDIGEIWLQQVGAYDHYWDIYLLSPKTQAGGGYYDRRA